MAKVHMTSHYVKHTIKNRMAASNRKRRHVEQLAYNNPCTACDPIMDHLCVVAIFKMAINVICFNFYHLVRVTLLVHHYCKI